MKNRQTIVLGLAAVALLWAGCQSGTTNSTTAPAGQPIRVKVQKIGLVAGQNSRSYTGTLEESVSVPLSFLVTGNVEKVLVEEGQRVSKGQLLAVLNSESYRNAYQVSLAKARQAQDAFDRLDAVYKKGSLPEVKYVEIQTGLEQARSMAAISEKNVKDCQLYAPSAGIIGKRMTEPGMSVVPGNPVFQLVKIEKVKASIPVPEKEISAMVKGEKALVRVSAISEQPFEGEVKEIGVLSNPLSHTYTVKIELNNPEGTLKPGMVCEATVTHAATAAGRMVVPLSAIQQNGQGEKYVFVANGGRSEQRRIETGALDGNGVMVTKGLSAGDLLITEGWQKIGNQSAIEIIN